MISPEDDHIANKTMPEISIDIASAAFALIEKDKAQNVTIKT